MNGKKLPEEQIQQLVTKGRTNLFKGFKKTTEQGSYDACLVRDGKRSKIAHSCSAKARLNDLHVELDGLTNDECQRRVKDE
jgi:hypothetical protein